MSIAKHRDPSYLKTDVIFKAQQIGSFGSDITGSSIDLQNKDMPDGAVVEISFNSGNNSDDVDFQLQKSSDDSSWSDISGANATGLSGDTPTATIEVSNLQSQDRYLRMIYDSANSSVSSTNFECAATVTFVGAKEV